MPKRPPPPDIPPLKPGDFIFVRYPNRTKKFEVLSVNHEDATYETVERGYGDERISTYEHASIEKWHAEKLAWVDRND